MSTTSVRERIFAWVAVVVAFLAAIALSVAVIIQQAIMDRNQAQAPTTLNCTDSNAEQPIDPPQKFVPNGAVTTLQTTDLTVGSGKAAQSGDCLVVKYYGTLASDGTVFDENFSKTEALAFTLGQSQVIPGWDQGLVGMKVGGERRLVIPSDLAYGPTGSGAIPANAALVFDIKLLKIH